MATDSTNSPSAAAAVPAPPTPEKATNFSSDSTMPRLRLSADQLLYCSEALQHFQTKAPQTIRQEFMTLQYGNHRIISQPLKKSETELLIILVFELRISIWDFFDPNYDDMGT